MPQETLTARGAMISQRNRQPELMDQPELDPALHAAALRGLRRVNSATRSAAILWPAIAAAARRQPGETYRVLDLACGSGDNALAIARFARRAGLDIQVAGCDLSRLAIEEARGQATSQRVSDATFFCHDVLADRLPLGYHTITCSLFLHHLGEEQAIELLREMAAASSDQVVICDLRRTWLGLGLAWAGCRLLTRSPVVHVDAVLSVQAAFEAAEIKQLAARGGLDGCVVTHHWPQRWLLTWRKA